MESDHTIVDGNKIKYLESVPVKGKYEETVIFDKSVDEDAEIEAKIKRMEACCGIFDDEMMEIMKEIIEERKNFFKGREEYDFS